MARPCRAIRAAERGQGSVAHHLAASRRVQTPEVPPSQQRTSATRSIHERSDLVQIRLPRLFLLERSRASRAKAPRYVERLGESASRSKLSDRQSLHPSGAKNTHLQGGSLGRCIHRGASAAIKKSARFHVVSNFAEAAERSDRLATNRTKLPKSPSFFCLLPCAALYTQSQPNFEHTRTLLPISAIRVAVVEVNPRFSGYEPSGGVDQ
jgi:hypothetical protein